jgi:hypothetical protein
MPYTEFFVIGQGGAASNGGGPRMTSTGGPVLEVPNASVLASIDLARKIITKTTDSVGVVVGDWCYVKAGSENAKLMRVVNIDNSHQTDKKLTVDRTVSGINHTGDTVVNVGGAWDSLASGAALLSVDWPSGTNRWELNADVKATTPRINVKSGPWSVVRGHLKLSHNPIRPATVRERTLEKPLADARGSDRRAVTG